MMKYRASFQQPKGDLNPLGLTVNHPVIVEVFSVGTTERKFNARTISDQGQPVRVLNYNQSSHRISGPPDIVKAQVCHLFERQLTEWEAAEEHMP
jgi:hypothetical protein